MDITENFARNDYQVGIYFYAPSIGDFDPEPAKWIIFLYQDLTRMSVSFPGVSEIVPDQFLLYQNHPNPFNPSTTISYELYQPTKVWLAVYDLLGREVTVLVEGIQPSGRHETIWDVQNVTGSIYFYRLTTPNSRITKKLVLLK